MTGRDAIVFVAVIAVVIFCPWYIGVPLVLVYNCYVGFRAGQESRRLARMRDEIAKLEAENKAQLEKRFR